MMDEHDLYQNYDQIMSWSYGFLVSVSKFPTNGEYTAGDLISRYEYHTMSRHENDATSAVEFEVNQQRHSGRYYDLTH